MKTSDILIGIAVALGVVVAYKMFIAPASQPASGTNGTNPTLAGVAGIVGATSGLIDSITNLVKPKTEESDDDASTRTAQLGRIAIGTQPQLFGGTQINSGFAVVG